jgi:hypothetical protein
MGTCDGAKWPHLVWGKDNGRSTICFVNDCVLLAAAAAVSATCLENECESECNLSVSAGRLAADTAADTVAVAALHKPTIPCSKLVVAGEIRERASSSRAP